MTVEPWLNGMIRAQHGAVTLGQLQATGLTRSQIATRVRRGTGAAIAELEHALDRPRPRKPSLKARAVWARPCRRRRKRAGARAVPF